MHIATREKCNILSILSDGEMLEKTKCPNYFISKSTAWSLVISMVNNQFSYGKTYHRKIKLKYSEMTMKTPLWILKLKEILREIKNPNSRYLEWIQFY
jgi:hypothetical protein